MKLLSAQLLLLLVSLTGFANHLSAQCTTNIYGQWPANRVPLNTNNTPKILGTDCNTGEYSTCYNVVNGRSYTVTSSVATDYITITNKAGQPLSNFYGTQPLTFTATTVDTIRIYRHLSATCNHDAAHRTITVTCNDCGSASPPSNDVCSAATSIGNGTTISMSVANASSDNAPECGGVSASTQGVWFVYNMPTGQSGTVTLTGCNSNYDFSMRVFEGECSNLICVEGDNDGDCGGAGAESTIFTFNTNFNDGHVEERAAKDYFVLVTGAGGLLEFTVSTLLPVELKGFKAMAAERSNILEWATASEANAQEFGVERSGNGVDDWQEIGAVPAVGSSTIESNYFFEDTEPLPMSYYRLRSKDLDGKYEFSSIVSVEREIQHLSLGRLYPSPASETIHLEVQLQEAALLNVQILDVVGRALLDYKTEREKGANRIRLDISNLLPNHYFVVLDNGVERLMRPFVKK